jgi:hypothetical protein
MDLIYWPLLTVVGSFAGAYLNSYVKTKGTNLATHEDIEMVLQDLRASTRATKEVENEFLKSLWDRQKRWELKRDVLFEAAKRFAVVGDALVAMYGTHSTYREKNEIGKRAEVDSLFHQAANEFEQAAFLVDLICGQRVQDALIKYRIFVRSLAQVIMDGRPEAYKDGISEIVDKTRAVTDAMREELEVGKPS